MEDWKGGLALTFPPPARGRGGRRVLYPKKKNRPDQVLNWQILEGLCYCISLAFQNFLTLIDLKIIQAWLVSRKFSIRTYTEWFKSRNSIPSSLFWVILLISGSNTLEAKPRSRSLIRRASRKTKQQIRDAQVDECHVS